MSSPTVQLDSIIITLAIDAKEGRDVATADVTGAYLKTEMTNQVIVKVEGEAASIMCEVNPGFSDYMKRKGKSKCYICGCRKRSTAVCSLHYFGTGLSKPNYN